MREYTREEILSMEVGRELNELIAEKVMNIPVSVKKRKFEYVHVPHYSTDISAAWEVEEKMGNDELFWKYDNNVKKQLLARLGKVTEFDMMHAPADVRCKAALLAVME